MPKIVGGGYDDLPALSTADKADSFPVTWSGGRRLVRRTSAAVGVLALALSGAVLGAGSAAAATTISSHYLLDHLVVRAEHDAGYTSTSFHFWIDADHDGCNTSREVLLAEAVVAPHVGTGCTLTGGTWNSRYDGATVTGASAMVTDQLVSPQEAWQSGAWRWNRDTRTRFANDLGYPQSLNAVSKTSAQAKAGREVTAWLPPNTSFDCSYLAWWVAVKWRWQLAINPTEKTFLTNKLTACGWPSVRKPARALVVFSSIDLAFVGDTILGNTPRLPSQPGSYLDPVRPTLAADLTFGNFEGTFTTDTVGKCGTTSGGGCYQFRNPPTYANIFHRDGYDVLNLANNHSHDFGADGLRSTKSAIVNAGMRYTGLPGQITYLTRNGIRVAFVGFAPYAYANNLLDLATAATLIRQARSQASVVVVYMHAGAEGANADHVTGTEEHFVGEDRGNPELFAHRAIDNGAILVIASGPHVMRGMQFYRGRLIAYSLGDFASFWDFSTSGVLGHSGILRVTLSDTGAFLRARLVSVRLTTQGQAYLGGQSVSFVRTLSGEDFGTTSPLFSSTGVITRR